MFPSAWGLRQCDRTSLIHPQICLPRLTGRFIRRRNKGETVTSSRSDSSGVLIQDGAKNVGWVEQRDTHQLSPGNDGYRYAQPILRGLRDVKLAISHLERRIERLSDDAL